jgi:hypothetical protein
MNIQQIRIIDTGIHSWYKDDIGKLFDVNLDIKPEGINYKLVDTPHNRAMVRSNLLSRLEKGASPGLGVRKVHAIVTTFQSNREAKVLLQQEEI